MQSLEHTMVYQVFFQRGTERQPNWDSAYKTLKEAEARVNELEMTFLQLQSSNAKVWCESTSVETDY